MIFYRRNTFSDKAVSFLGIMLAVVLFYNSMQSYKVLGSASVWDILIGIVGLAVGIVFIYTSRFKYFEITEDKLTWYTWFVIKHTLTKEEIKDITTKQRYYIVSRYKGSDLWLSKLYVRKEDDDAVNEALKKLIKR